MNCIFICVFNQEKYIELFYLLVKSIRLYGNLGDTEILVYTSTLFMNKIKQSVLYNEQMKFEINDTYDTADKACKSRLDLFEFKSISRYDKILYLDTDIIIKNDINKLFDIVDEDILYVLEEGTIDDTRDYWGKTLFGEEIDNYNKPAFNSGIMLFNNCEKIKVLFGKIKEDIIARPYYDNYYMDQPYIVYNAFKYNLYDNQTLKKFAINDNFDINSNIAIHHFPGGIGECGYKLFVITSFLNKLNNDRFKNRIPIYDTNTPPRQNKNLSLIGICVSYDYYDTLQFMLPVNYSHFDKIYIITQEDDIDTIQLCSKFDNVVVLYYNFKNNNKIFDKYGGLNYAQEIVYKKHPDSWYLNIDSDIILPNNFIDILIKENLNPECIYGAVRNNCFTTSELLDKKQIVNKVENITLNNNDILYWGGHPPTIIGFFQLYKKKCYHRHNLIDASHGDNCFCHDNFKLFCMLENISCIHLGTICVNWNGKVVYFIDDVDIQLKDIYFACDKVCNNTYYNEKCQLVKYGKSKNIDDDIWTCSEQMRYDIYDFFKNKSYKIAEIGAHKGYTTSILSNIFTSVYAVDNNVDWTNFNKEFNKDATNIKYVHLDIYKYNWNVLPDDIEVSFIDAVHSYEHCKSDIFNSIKQFKTLQYIIFDDYGVWDGVRKVVDELITNKTLVFERYIGITDVPGPNGIVKNVHEGIICKINKFTKPPSKPRILRMGFY